MSLTVVFSHARRAALGRKSPPWRLGGRFGVGVESVDYRGWMMRRSASRSSSRSQVLFANPWFWWARAWAGMCPPRPAPAWRRADLFVGTASTCRVSRRTRRGCALPHRHRARLARRHRAGRQQHPLGSRAPRCIACARFRSPIGDQIEAICSLLKSFLEALRAGTVSASPAR